MLGLSKAYSVCFLLTNSSDNVTINYLFFRLYSPAAVPRLQGALQTRPDQGLTLPGKLPWNSIR